MCFLRKVCSCMWRVERQIRCVFWGFSFFSISTNKSTYSARTECKNFRRNYKIYRISSCFCICIAVFCISASAHPPCPLWIDKIRRLLSDSLNIRFLWNIYTNQLLSITSNKSSSSSPSSPTPEKLYYINLRIFEDSVFPSLLLTVSFEFLTYDRELILLFCGC